MWKLKSCIVLLYLFQDGTYIVVLYQQVWVYFQQNNVILIVTGQELAHVFFPGQNSNFEMVSFCSNSCLAWFQFCNLYIDCDVVVLKFCVVEGIGVSHIAETSYED